MTRRGRLLRAAVVLGLVAAPVLLAAAVRASAPEWNIARIGGPGSAAGTTIAVVDTGVDGTHPAFDGRVLPAIDVVGAGEGDANGHGTHVAGVAAGADAGCGVIGVAPDARILPVRVLDGEGAGTVDDVAAGIRRAADAGATVVNLSLGTDVVLRSISGSGLADAIRYAWSKGSIPVLAAGNDGLFGGLLGSGYGEVPAVVVTATDHRDRVAGYATSIGSAEWGVAAPGGDTSGEDGRDILSAYPDRRCALHAGTSMAAPHVAGALAALRSRGLPPEEAVTVLLDTAVDLGPRGHDATYGHGLVDLQAALASVGAPGDTTTPSTDVTVPASVVAEPPAEPSASTSTTRPRLAPTAPPRPADTAAPRADQPETAAPPEPAPAPASERDPTSTTDQSLPEPAGSPQAVVVTDDIGDRGAPGVLVAVAWCAVAAAGAGTAVAARRLPRR